MLLQSGRVDKPDSRGSWLVGIAAPTVPFLLPGKNGSAQLIQWHDKNRKGEMAKGK